MSSPLKQQEPLKWEDGDEYDPELKLELQVPYAGKRLQLALQWYPEEKLRPVLLTIAPVPFNSDGGWETAASLSREDMRVLREFFGMMLALDDSNPQ